MCLEGELRPYNIYQIVIQIRSNRIRFLFRNITISAPRFKIIRNIRKTSRLL